METLRPATLSGSWYPSDPDRLATAVRAYTALADPAANPAGKPLLAVAPHAGYIYSGPTAGRLYGLLRGIDYEQVFILAPSHRAPLTRIALPSVDAFATPLGEVPVACETVAKLSRQEAFAVNHDAHAAEHAIEIQLPFLQQICGDHLRIVPMLVPPLSTSRREAAAAALSRWCDGKSLFIVSSDFTHFGAAYGYTPFHDRIGERLRELDTGAIDIILNRDPAALLAYGDRTGITMCGIHAAALALSLPLPDRLAGALIDYRRSGDRDGDYSLSVSYAAILLADPAVESAGDRGQAAPTEEGVLDGKERRFLLALARRVVEAVARGDRPPAIKTVAEESGTPWTPRLQDKRGAFVTLTCGGHLRGCIGYIEGLKPLFEAVADNAAAAASRDPRFAPVRADELAGIRIEISALTPLRKIRGSEEIALGRHGILLRKGRAQAVFLPQVAPEQGWDLPTTLDHLALKAGLPRDGWRQNAKFEIFEAEVFAEDSA
jgi:AmmeMemoRadiSam system protein B/AmmeMemoRadiSam system protein A